MSPKIKTTNDCRSRSEFIQHAEQSDQVVVFRRGKYTRIKSMNGSCAELYDSPEDLPKYARATFVQWFARLGVVAFIGALLYWIATNPNWLVIVGHHFG